MFALRAKGGQWPAPTNSTRHMSPPIAQKGPRTMDFREAYLDNAATSRPCPEAVAAVVAAMGEGFGNASAEHARGKRAKALLEESRATVAEALGVDADEVFFTSGGTESNNLAIAGACRAVREERRSVVASEVEHPSVTKTVRGLKREGWQVDYLPAYNGNLALGKLERVLGPDTALITCMHVQNETGFILPVAEVAAMRDARAPQALVHTDAVQAFGKIDFLPRELGVDLASVSSHKIGGPQGIGALYVKRGTRMFTTAFGGGQERGLRSGTEALPLIAGFAAAVRVAFADRAQAEARAAAHKRRLLAGIAALCPEVRVNSRDDGSPFVVSFSVPGMDNTAALQALSDAGVYVSKASACATLFPDIPPEAWRAKHPMSLLQCGIPEPLVESTLRVSFSQESTLADVERFLEVFGAFIRSAAS